jgi:hypothetical protein
MQHLTVGNLPDLPDMMAVGMGLTEALAFWSRMMNSPERDNTDWWQESGIPLEPAGSIARPRPAVSRRLARE